MKNLIFIFVLATFICGCGNRDNERTLNPPLENGIVEGPEEYAVTETVELTIRAIGNTMTDIAFEPNTISIPQNTPVRITLVNESSTDGMSHNIVIINKGAGDAVAQQALEAGEGAAYVPPHPDVIAGSPLALPGRTVTMEFISPVAGTYHFICTYPGHYPQMIGRLNTN
jgi:azurin